MNFISKHPIFSGKETLADEKWSDTLGTDTDQLNQSFVKTTNTDSTRKQVATYPAGFIKSSGDITCLYKYSYSGEIRTYSYTFQVKVESEFQNLVIRMKFMIDANSLYYFMKNLHDPL